MAVAKLYLTKSTSVVIVDFVKFKSPETLPTGLAETKLMNNELTDNATHDKTTQIFVNSRPRKVEEAKITFEQVLELAGFNPSPAELDLYDVEWFKGNEAGTLTKGHSVDVKNGMRFDAGKSNRS